MAIDLEAIKKKIAQMSGQRTTSGIQIWKPTVGEFRVRGMHWKNPDPASPIAERWFYYLGNERGFLQPLQFKKPDPVNEMIKSLYASGKPEDRELAKQLRAKMSGYMPIIVRGQEEKGVQVWKFPPGVNSKLLTYWVDAEKNEDLVDIFDPKEGYDIRVTYSEKQGASSKYLAAETDLARRPSKLSDDPALVAKWLEAVPNLDDLYQQKTTQEVETILNNWLNSDDTTVKSDGTAKGPKGEDELEKLANEVKGTKAAKKAVTEEKAPAKSKDLDDAFADLMKDD